MARRLTSHPAEESRAASRRMAAGWRSPRLHAGPREAYAMPLAGGAKRISFENGNALVLGWSAQGQVLYGTLSPVAPAVRSVVVAVWIRWSAAPCRWPKPMMRSAADGRTLYFVRYAWRDRRQCAWLSRRRAVAVVAFRSGIECRGRAHRPDRCEPAPANAGGWVDRW